MITWKNVAAVIPFIDRLKAVPKGAAAVWPTPRENSDGTQVLSLEPIMDPTIYELKAALNTNGFIQPFDWPEWQAEAEKFVEYPDLLKNVDLGTCCKLLTLHTRKDRFCSGHFAAMVENGHISHILKRLSELPMKSEDRLLTRIPKSRAYIASNPSFILTGQGRPPKLQAGQMTMVYECLEHSPEGCSLEDMVGYCIERGFESLFKNPKTDIRKSILYHLDRLFRGTENVAPGIVRPI